LRPLAEELRHGRGDLGRPAGSGCFAQAGAAALAEAVQPAADGFVGLARDGGDLLQGVALVGEQNHLGPQAGAWARGPPQGLLEGAELSPTRPDMQGRTHKAPP